MKLYWKKLYKSRREKMRHLVLCMYGHVYLPYLYRIDPLIETCQYSFVGSTANKLFLAKISQYFC